MPGGGTLRYITVLSFLSHSSGSFGIPCSSGHKPLSIIITIFAGPVILSSCWQLEFYWCLNLKFYLLHKAFPHHHLPVSCIIWNFHSIWQQPGEKQLWIGNQAKLYSAQTNSVWASIFTLSVDWMTDCMNEWTVLGEKLFWVSTSLFLE